ncbi:hypothetical protein ODS41_04375 [Pyrobaculum sp. 3827-6]|uniref:hypothetical protein n=1 Tax=Pyrobaculum sp. 3827-6 TaxID=2983604 RepID=UPI0021DB7112|nr:hypothetical protein [Pyrobaculum sp. 3827-6]MCU7787159.1 hypothetical protein [Pyrobaculum sp. 3827-6]
MYHATHPPNHTSSVREKTPPNKNITAGHDAAHLFALPGVTVVPIYRLTKSSNSYYVPVRRERVEGPVERGDVVQLLVMAPHGGYPVTVDGRVLRIYKNVVQVYIQYRQYKPLIDQAIAGGGYLYLIKVIRIPRLAAEGGV